MVIFQRNNPKGRVHATRRRILEAAISVFARKGYHEASMDEIVAESSSSKGSLYSHFPGKQQMFLAIVEEFVAGLQERLDAAIAESHDGVERVEAALRVCMETFGQHRSLAKILLVQALGLGAAFEHKRLEVHRRFIRVIKSYLDQAVDEGAIPPLDTQVAAHAWMGALNEVVIQWVHTGEPAPERALPALRNILLRSVGVSEQRINRREAAKVESATAVQLERPAQLAALHARLAAGETVIVSRTVPWPAVSLTGFLRKAGGLPRLYWSHAGNPLAFAGFGEAARVVAPASTAFDTVRSASAAVFARILSTGEQPPAQVQPRLFGGFAFREEVADEMWTAFPAACFVLPQVLLTRHQGKVWLTLNMCLQPGSDVQHLEERVVAELERLRALPDDPAVLVPGPATAAVALQTQAQWAASVRIATAQIRAGELQKVVLARALELPHSIDPLAALIHLKQHYAGTYRYLIEPEAGCAFFGATPELLVQSDGHVLRSTALAGSIRRGVDAPEDAALGRELLASAKDRGEHDLVVRDICSLLQPFVKTVAAAQEPNLRRLSNIQHLQTAIEGEALAGVDLLAVAAALHPTPALGGVPRVQALKLLAELEPTGRGWFGAPVGWLDANGGGLLAVAIRCAVTNGTTARLYAGAGIVADSDPEREWNETELKLRPMLDALSA